MISVVFVFDLLRAEMVVDNSRVVLRFSCCRAANEQIV